MSSIDSLVRLQKALAYEDTLLLRQRELLSQYDFVLKHQSQNNTKDTTTMSQPRLNTYQYTVWFRDPKDSEKDEKIGGVETVEAINVEHATRIAIRKLDAAWDAKIQNISVDVRPF